MPCAAIQTATPRFFTDSSYSSAHALAVRRRLASSLKAFLISENWVSRAGTAELSGYGKELNLVRCEALVDRTFDLFPDAGERDSAQFWTGLRPATPSNVPLVGSTRYRNLFLDTGHGTLGWTMACGSGKALSDVIAGRQPGVDFAFARQS